MTDDPWVFGKRLPDWKFPVIMAQTSTAYELRTCFWTLPWTFLLYFTTAQLTFWNSFYSHSQSQKCFFSWNFAIKILWAFVLNLLIVQFFKNKYSPISMYKCMCLPDFLLFSFHKSCWKIKCSELNTFLFIYLIFCMNPILSSLWIS